MRYLFATTSLLLLLAAPLGSQTQTTILIATEQILNTYSVSLRGLPVISTNASSGTDCTFGSGTGGFIVSCHWCDSTSTWIVTDAECVVPSAQNWTNNAGSAWTNNAGSAWTNN